MVSESPEKRPPVDHVAERCESFATRYARGCREFRGLEYEWTAYGWRWYCWRHRGGDGAPTR